MDEEQNYDKRVPQIHLDNTGPWDMKVVAGYVLYGALLSGAAFLVGNLIEKRTVNRVNTALLDDWLQGHNETSGETA